jgi:hypothetical protein
LEKRIDYTNEWLKLLLGEDAKVNDDSNEEDVGGAISEDRQEKHSDWDGDEEHEENDSDCNGNEDLLEGEGDEEEWYESEEEDYSKPTLNTDPSDSRNSLHSFDYHHEVAKFESNGESYCPFPLWSKYPEWDGNHNGRQIGTKVSTSKMDRVRTSAAFSQVLQSTEVKL